MVHCADEILALFKDAHDSGSNELKVPMYSVRECVEAAETIALCAQHQKSIVDDILTVSKLDSHLLVITPTVVQPVAVTRQAIKMCVI